MEIKTSFKDKLIANRAMMNAIKVERGCELCGYNAHPAALQFDHIDPATKYRNKHGAVVHPSHMVKYAQSVILAEIAKCRVLCANCHMIYTHTEQRR